MSLTRKIEEAQKRARKFQTGATSWKPVPLHERMDGKRTNKLSIVSVVVTVLIFGALGYIALNIIGFFVLVSAASWAK